MTPSNILRTVGDFRQDGKGIHRKLRLVSGMATTWRRSESRFAGKSSVATHQGMTGRYPGQFRFRTLRG